MEGKPFDRKMFNIQQRYFADFESDQLHWSPDQTPQTRAGPRYDFKRAPRLIGNFTDMIYVLQRCWRFDRNI